MNAALPAAAGLPASAEPSAETSVAMPAGLPAAAETSPAPSAAPASSPSAARRSARGAAWAALPLALLRGALDLLRPGRLLAWVVASLAAAALPTAAALWAWDAAVAWAQGDLLASPMFAWWLGAAEQAGLGGVRAMLGPVLIFALWWPAVLGLVAWVQRVALFPRPGSDSGARWMRAAGGAGLVLVFWLVWFAGLIALPLWLILLPLVGLAAPLLLWAWLLWRLVGPLPASASVRRPLQFAAALIALASVLPPLALAAPLWLARTAEQLRARLDGEGS